MSMQTLNFHRPQSHHNLSSLQQKPSKPCHHVWGPCAADHTHHHARSVHHHHSRSSSTGRSSGRSSSPWDFSSSGSSGSSPIVKKIKDKKEGSTKTKHKRSSTKILPLTP